MRHMTSRYPVHPIKYRVFPQSSPVTIFVICDHVWVHFTLQRKISRNNLPAYIVSQYAQAFTLGSTKKQKPCFEILIL